MLRKTIAVHTQSNVQNLNSAAKGEKIKWAHIACSKNNFGMKIFSVSVFRCSSCTHVFYLLFNATTAAATMATRNYYEISPPRNSRQTNGANVHIVNYCHYESHEAKNCEKMYGSIFLCSFKFACLNFEDFFFQQPTFGFVRLR